MLLFLKTNLSIISFSITVDSQNSMITEILYYDSNIIYTVINFLKSRKLIENYLKFTIFLSKYFLKQR